jgi:hypothetical protein
MGRNAQETMDEQQSIIIIIIIISSSSSSEMGWGSMDWIDMAQDRDRWRALVNALMNLQVP